MFDIRLLGLGESVAIFAVSQFSMSSCDSISQGRLTWVCRFRPRH